MVEHFVCSLLLIVIAQAAIVLLFRLKDTVQINHPSASKCTGLPDARRPHACSLVPMGQDGDFIHVRPQLGPMTRATIEWYLERGGSGRLQADFRPEDN
jgi:hypothetical protein